MPGRRAVAAAAAASLQDQAIKLTAAVSVFSLDPATPAAPACADEEAFHAPTRTPGQERRALHSPLRGMPGQRGPKDAPQRRRG